MIVGDNVGVSEGAVGLGVYVAGVPDGVAVGLGDAVAVRVGVVVGVAGIPTPSSFRRAIVVNGLLE